MKCPHCSFENEDGAAFCENCGEVFPAAEAPSLDIPAVRTPSTDEGARGAVLAEVPAVVKIPEVVVDAAPLSAGTGSSMEPHKPDFSGFERLVDSSYRPPEMEGIHAGDTAEIPIIREEYVPQARNYTMGLTERQLRQREREQRRMAKKFAKHQQKEEARAAREAALAAPVAEASLAPAEDVPLDEGVEESVAALTVKSAPIIIDDEPTELPGNEEPLYTEATVTSVSEKGETEPQKTAVHGAATAYAHNHRSRRLPKKGAFIAGACVLLALALCGTAWATYSAELWGGRTIPEVVGLSQDQAISSLDERGFSVEITEEKSDVAPGTVLTCSPGQGTRAQEGSAVALTVAVARTVPAVVGLTQQEAVDALAAEGLETVEVTEQKSNEADGAVLSVSPEAGTPVLSSDAIALVVAVPFTVPNTDGMDEKAATEALEAEGYTVKTRWSYNEDVSEGTALYTEPEAGTQLDSGSEVVLYLAKSRASELVSLAESILPGARLKSGDARYIIDEVKSVDYAGDDVVKYSCTAHQYEDVELPFGLGKQRYEDDKKVPLEGTLTFNSDNEVTTADPSISYS